MWCFYTNCYMQAVKPGDLVVNIPDKEVVGSNDTVKKPRRWNAEGLKGSEPQSGNIVSSTTPKGLTEPTPKLFSEGVNEAPPKERHGNF